MVNSLGIKLWRDLKSLKAQVITVGILVAAGVGLLISSWSAYRSLQYSRDDYYERFALADVFASVKRAPLFLTSQLEKIPGIRTIETRLVFEGLVDIQNQSEPAVGRFISIPDNGESVLNKIYLRNGRMPEVSNEFEVVVHEGFAFAHKLNPGDHFGALIQGHKKDFLVVGIGISPEYIYALSASSPLPDDKHFGVFWLNRHNLEQLTGMSSSFNDVSFTVFTNYSEKSIISEIDRLLKPYGAFGAYGRSRQTSAVFVNDEISQQKITAIFSPFVFLSIAAFLVHVISARLIALQRLQVATIKALGYSNKEISAHYTKLILIMVLLGILPGIALGAWLGQQYSIMYQDFFRFPSLNFSLNIESALVGIIAGIVPGLIGAFSAVREAFSLAPAEAMRPPAPPSFHRSLLDKFKFTSVLSIHGRMLWRNLFFRPWRLFLTVMGLSAALAVMILTGFWSDAFNVLLDVQFQRVQKEDVSLSLITPQPVNIVQELKDTAGVIQSEAYRISPVRISYLHHKKEISVLGFPPQLQLRQLLDQQFKPIHIPESGLFLSRYFQKEWGLQSGDTIGLEFLEGKQPIRDIKIAGFTDEFMGQSAVISIAELWKILGEQSTYNMINLKSDPRYEKDLYIKFKSTPNIASINFKTVMYRGFQKSFGELMQRSTNIMIIFALVIAISIIYNSVRVSFSERNWEMASLRVLGFTKFRVFLMLLAEITAQVLLSVLPGCLLGYYLSYLSLQMINTEYFTFPLIISYKVYARAVLIQYFSLIMSFVIIWFMLKKLNMVEALKARD